MNHKGITLIGVVITVVILGIVAAILIKYGAIDMLAGGLTEIKDYAKKLTGSLPGPESSGLPGMSPGGTGTGPGDSGDPGGTEPYTGPGDKIPAARPIKIQSMEEWCTCGVDDIKKKIAEKGATAEEIACFSKGGAILNVRYPGQGDWAGCNDLRCYCFNQIHMDTGPPANKVSFVSVVETDDSKIQLRAIYNERGGALISYNPSFKYITWESPTDTLHCAVDDNFCFRLLELKNGVATIEASKQHTEPSTRLEIGKRYTLKKSESYTVTTPVDTYNIVYDHDNDDFVYLKVSKLAGSVVNCNGFRRDPWPLQVLKKSRCKDLNLCGYVSFRYTKLNVIDFTLLPEDDC